MVLLAILWRGKVIVREIWAIETEMGADSQGFLGPGSSVSGRSDEGKGSTRGPRDPGYLSNLVWGSPFLEVFFYQSSHVLRCISLGFSQGLALLLRFSTYHTERLRNELTQWHLPRVNQLQSHRLPPSSCDCALAPSSVYYVSRSFRTFGPDLYEEKRWTV